MKDKTLQSKYQPNIAKLPFRYLINVKRGMIWSTRILEITKHHIKYFTPETNELRFNESIESCEMLSLPSKNIIELKSKENTFKSVQIKSEKEKIINKIKADFNYISIISQQSHHIEDKIIEQEKPLDSFIKSPLSTEQNDKDTIEWHYFTNSQHCFIEYTLDSLKNYIRLSDSNNNLITYLGLYFQYFYDEMKSIHKTHFKSSGFAISAFYLSLYAIFPFRKWYLFHVIFSIIFWVGVIRYILSHYKIKKDLFFNIGQDNTDLYQLTNCNYNNTLQMIKLSSFFQNETILDFVNNCYRNISFNQSWMDITDLSLTSINLYEYTLRVNGSSYLLKRIINQIDEVTYRIIDWINEQKLFITHIEQSKMPNYVNKMKVCLYIPMKTVINNQIHLSIIKRTIDQMDKIHLMLMNGYFDKSIQKNSNTKNDIEMNTKILKELFNKSITEWDIKEERRATENHSYIKFYQIKNQRNMVRADIMINLPINVLYEKLQQKPFIINRNYYSIKLSAKIELKHEKVLYQSNTFTASLFSWNHKINHITKLVFVYCDNSTLSQPKDKLVFNQPSCTIWMNDYKKVTSYDVLDDSFVVYNLLSVADSQTLLSYVECSSKDIDKETIDEIFNSLGEIHLIL